LLQSTEDEAMNRRKKIGVAVQHNMRVNGTAEIDRTAPADLTGPSNPHDLNLEASVCTIRKRLEGGHF
jgi:hypothetical protein